MVLHAPFAAPVPANWDSVQFALGIERFDVAAHQPHPPGYPLYIALGWLLSRLTGDPNAALVALSLLGGAIASALLVALGRRLTGSLAAGAVAGVLFAVSPLVWYYSAVGLTYAVEATLAGLVVLLTWELVTRPRLGVALGSALALGVAGGVRPSTLLFLAPLWLAGLVLAGRLPGWVTDWSGDKAARWLSCLRPPGASSRLGLTPGQQVLTVAVLGLTVLAWLVPLLWLSGGPGAYLAASARLAAIAGNSSSVWRRGPAALLENAAFAGPAAAVGLNAVLALVPLLRWRRFRPALPATGWLLLLLWVVPALAFFLTVHIGQAGYLLLVLPAAYLLAGAGLRRLAVGRPGRLALLTLLFGGLSAATFLDSPNDLMAPYLDEQTRFWHGVEQIARADGEAAPLVLTGARAWESFRLASYLLPVAEVRAIGDSLDPAGGRGEVFRGYAHHSTYVVFLDGALARPVVELDHPVRTVLILDDSALALVPPLPGCARVAVTERRTITRCELPAPIEALRSAVPSAREVGDGRAVAKE